MVDSGRPSPVDRDRPLRRLTPRQCLGAIELPLALPTIWAGIKTAAAINVGTATVAVFVGAGGFGERTGLALNDTAAMLAGALLWCSGCSTRPSGAPDRRAAAVRCIEVGCHHIADGVARQGIACRSFEKLGIERRSPVREANVAYALLFTLLHSRETLMKSIQVSWLHAAGALAIVLGTTGCAMTAPKAERYMAPPMGATWVSERRDTGSYGSATVQLPSKRGELMWEGKPHVTFETPESAIVSRPEGGWIGVFRDGKPLMMWNPPANFEWPLTVGATFSKDYSLTMYPAQQTVTYTSTSRVEAYEDVTVPAGAFKAFKVRTTDTMGNDNVVWFSPELGIFVKQNNRRTAQHAQGPGTRDIEMVSQSIRK